MVEHTAFVAYPGSPPELAATIRDAVKEANAGPGDLSLQLWEHNDIAGRPLSVPVLSGIEQARVLVADITRLNFNVTYEVGYAIGIQKRVLLIKYSAITSDDTLVLRTGVFDTLGYRAYSDAERLAEIFQRVSDLTPLKIEAELDTRAPAYLLETPVRTPEMTRIVARVKRARLFYRSFSCPKGAEGNAEGRRSHVVYCIRPQRYLRVAYECQFRFWKGGACLT